jgi:hypothetical protein
VFAEVRKRLGFGSSGTESSKDLKRHQGTKRQDRFDFVTLYAKNVNIRNQKICRVSPCGVELKKQFSFLDEYGHPANC